jgi:hypothetical protein
MRFDIRNARSLCSSGSHTTVARELARYSSDLVGVQEVRWEKRGHSKCGGLYFLYGKGNENHQ